MGSTISILVIENFRDPLAVSLKINELTTVFKQVFEVESHHSIRNTESEKINFIGASKICKIEDCLRTGLPQKSNVHVPLTDNRNICLNHLKSLHSKLKWDPEIVNSYRKISQEQLTTGVIERVPKELQNKENAHMMPHRMVGKD